MIWKANFVGPKAFSFFHTMENKLRGSYHCRGCIVFELSNFVEKYHCRGCIVFELSNFVEDVFQGFKVLYNMESKLCGIYIIWKGIAIKETLYIPDRGENLFAAGLTI